MKNFFRKFFDRHHKSQNKNLSPDPQDLTSLSKIPRYPPFLEGLPFATPAQLLLTQKELIDQLKLTCGFNQRENQELLEPLLLQYAAFVHLLPASENHHHRGVGGLLRHGIEVAYLAARSSDSIIFSMGDTPQNRRNKEPKWRFACLVAGLLHDLGKPITDLYVTNRNGSLVWNPLTDNLYHWLKLNNIDRYFVHWRADRNHKHEESAILALNQILSAPINEYLSSKCQSKIIESMLHGITHTCLEDPLVKIVIKSDSDSVEKDILEQGYDQSVSMVGIPVDKYIFDAMRQLIKTKAWRINQSGAAVFYMEDGTYIDWNYYKDLLAILDEQKIPGIPRDRETLADLILDCGFGVPNIKDGQRYRYFEILPDLSPTIKVLGLKLDNIARIYSGELPPKIANLLDLEHEETIVAIPKNEESTIEHETEIHQDHESKTIDETSNDQKLDNMEQLANDLEPSNTESKINEQDLNNVENIVSQGEKNSSPTFSDQNNDPKPNQQTSSNEGELIDDLFNLSKDEEQYLSVLFEADSKAEKSENENQNQNQNQNQNKNFTSLEANNLCSEELANSKGLVRIEASSSEEIPNHKDPSSQVIANHEDLSKEVLPNHEDRSSELLPNIEVTSNSSFKESNKASVEQTKNLNSVETKLHNEEMENLIPSPKDHQNLQLKAEDVGTPQFKKDETSSSQISSTLDELSKSFALEIKEKRRKAKEQKRNQDHRFYSDGAVESQSNLNDLSQKNEQAVLKVKETQQSSQTQLSAISNNQIVTKWNKIFNFSLNNNGFLKSFFEPLLLRSGNLNTIRQCGDQQLLIDLHNEPKILDLKTRGSFIERLKSDGTITYLENNLDYIEHDGALWVLLNKKISKSLIKEFFNQSIKLEIMDLNTLLLNKAQNKVQGLKDLSEETNSYEINQSISQSSNTQTKKVRKPIPNKNEIENCINELIIYMVKGSSAYFERIEILDQNFKAIPISALEHLISDRYPMLSILNIKQRLRDPNLNLLGLLNISRQKIILEKLYDHTEESL